jgi:hypothetical protein
VNKATIHTACECQSKLGAELDERRHVLRAWARDRRGGKEIVAPAHSIGADKPRFDVAWSCPVCTRNQLRSFSADALSFSAS